VPNLCKLRLVFSCRHIKYRAFQHIVRAPQLRRSADEWRRDQVPRSRGRWPGTVAGDGSRCCGTASSGAAGTAVGVQTMPGLPVPIALPCCREGSAASPSCFALLINLALEFCCCLASESPGELAAPQVVYSAGHSSPGMGRLGSPRRGGMSLG